MLRVAALVNDVIHVDKIVVVDFIVIKVIVIVVVVVAAAACRITAVAVSRNRTV